MRGTFAPVPAVNTPRVAAPRDAWHLPARPGSQYATRRGTARCVAPSRPSGQSIRHASRHREMRGIFPPVRAVNTPRVAAPRDAWHLPARPGSQYATRRRGGGCVAPLRPSRQSIRQASRPREMPGTFAPVPAVNTPGATALAVAWHLRARPGSQYATRRGTARCVAPSRPSRQSVRQASPWRRMPGTFAPVRAVNTPRVAAPRMRGTFPPVRAVNTPRVAAPRDAWHLPARARGQQHTLRAARPHPAKS